MNSIIVFIKYPEPGTVKTRLAKDIGLQNAAELYRIFIFQTLELTREIETDSVHVAFAPESKAVQIREMLPNSFQLLAQRGADLGERMLNAFERVMAAGAKKVVILGSDSPTLPSKFIAEAFVRLDTCDLVLGPAEDGGYYLIGLKKIQPKLFSDIEWSTESVFDLTVKRAKNLGIDYALLPEWYDIDDLATLQRAAKDDATGKIHGYLKKENLLKYDSR